MVSVKDKIYRPESGDWDDSIGEFIEMASELVRRKVDTEELSEYVLELGSALGGIPSYLYYTRIHRDRALAKAYETYPKTGRNSEEQIALARKMATAEVSLHEYMKELGEAIKTRLSTSQSIGNWNKVQ